MCFRIKRKHWPWSKSNSHGAELRTRTRHQKERGETTVTQSRSSSPNKIPYPNSQLECKFFLFNSTNRSKYLLLNTTLSQLQQEAESSQSQCLQNLDQSYFVKPQRQNHDINVFDSELFFSLKIEASHLGFELFLISLPLLHRQHESCSEFRAAFSSSRGGRPPYAFSPPLSAAIVAQHFTV